MDEPQQAEKNWMDARPKLRDDLVFVPRTTRGRSGYVVEDPVRGKFFRLGIAEYAFVAELNGEATVAEALQRCRGGLLYTPLSNEATAGFLNWLAAAGLLEQTTSGAIKSGKAQPQRAAWWHNPIFIRIPLIAPDRLLDRLMPLFGWIGSGGTIAATLLLTAVSSLLVLPNSKALVGSLHSVFSTSGAIALLVCWTALKIVHEIGHGLVCRRYGARAREAGIMLLLFLPIPYIDVTSSWRLRDRRHRIHIAAAGMLLELLIAALAAIVWTATSPGVVHQLAANIVIMASVTTILFNANPLMRFDGYYILSDVLDVPNLYGQGQSWLRSRLRRYVLGLATPSPQLPRGLGAFMRIYAVAALVWRMLVYVGLILAAAYLWKGAGILLAAFALVTWFAIPLARWIKATFYAPARGPRPRLARMFGVLAGTTAVLAILFVYVPWPGAQACPAVADYAPLWLLRAPSDAWIDRLYVTSGQRVEKGQLLAELRNDDLELETARLNVRIQQAELAIRRFEEQKKRGEVQAEIQRLRSLQKQLAELESQTERLSVRAPAAGFVVSPRLADRLGTYVRQGEELLQIGDEERKEVLVAVTQDDLDRLSHRVGHPVRVAVPGGASFTSRLDRVKPRASTRPLHPALTAAAGGSLTVRRGSGESGDDQNEVHLLQPHFEAVVPLTSSAAKKLAAGQTLTVYLNGGRESIGRYLLDSAKSWFRSRTE